MRTENVVGPQPGTRNTPVNGRALGSGAVGVADCHGRYVEACYRGKLWVGSNLGGTPVTTQAGLSATTPALTLYNPVGSGVNLFLTHVGIAIQASPAAASELWLAYNLASAAAPSAVTLANVTPALVGGTQLPIGQCYRIATLATAPLMLLALGGTTGASAIGGVPLWFDIGGAIGLAPGVALAIQTSTATALTASFVWEEESLDFAS